MNIKTLREARIVLVKDQLISIAQRLGYMDSERINSIPVTQVNDGWNVKIHATKGIGLQIRHTLEVEIWQDDDRFIFYVDVLGANQCKNCYFPILTYSNSLVNNLSKEQFDDLCILPEIFADFVAGEMLLHYNRG